MKLLDFLTGIDRIEVVVHTRDGRAIPAAVKIGEPVQTRRRVTLRRPTLRLVPPVED